MVLSLKTCTIKHNVKLSVLMINVSMLTDECFNQAYNAECSFARHNENVEATSVAVTETK
jgi:hypothetical protein